MPTHLVNEYVSEMPSFIFIFHLKCLFYVRGTLNSSWNINSCSAKQSEECKNLEQEFRGKPITLNTRSKIFRKFEISMFWRHWWLDFVFFLFMRWTQLIIEADILWTNTLLNIGTNIVMRSVCSGSTRLFELVWFKVFKHCVWWQIAINKLKS